MMLGETAVAGALAGTYVLAWIIQAVIYGTLLAGLTWLLIRTVFRRSSPAIHCALWLIVLLKFILPIGPEWSWSLSNVIGDWRPAWSAAPVAQKSAPPAPTILECVVYPVTAGKIEVAPTLKTPPPPIPMSSLPGLWHPLNLLAAAYLLAVAVVALRRTIAYIRFARVCRQLPVAEDAARNAVCEVCARLGVTRLPDVRLSDAAPAPFVLGVFRPTLVLSSEQLNESTALEAVIWHEIAHLRRGDLLVRYVQWLAGTLLFFWPVVAWVNRRIDLAREFACDEWALRHSRISAGEYARLLLRAMQPARFVRGAYQPSAMAANSVHVERRIEMILDAKFVQKARRGLASPALLLVGGWSALVLTSALRPAEVVTEKDQVADVASIPNLFDLPVWLQAAYEQQACQPTQPAIQEVYGWQLAAPFETEGFEIQVERSFPTMPTFTFALARDALANRNADMPLFDCAIEVEGQPASMAWLAARSLDSADGPFPPPQVAIACEGTWQTADADVLTFVTGDEAGADAAALQMFVMQRVAFGSDADLEKFRQEHITADADGDGTLTPVERDAYLVALAMYEPKGVLAKFPNADRDTDGKLEAVEAARLVQGGPMMNFTAGKRVHVAHAAAGAPAIASITLDGASCGTWTTAGDAVTRTVEVEATQGDGDGSPRIVRMVVNGKEVDPAEAGETIELHVGPDDVTAADCNIVRRIESVDADGARHVQVLRQIVTTDGSGPTAAAFIAGAHASAMPNCVPLAAPGEAATWLLENVKLNPKLEEVAKYIVAVEEAPLATFLELNPDSDLNHDGRLTTAERDAFSEKQTSSMRASVLEKHPDADLNGDGLLTAEEMHNFFKSFAPKAGAALDVHPRIRIERRINDGSSEGQVEVRVQTCEEAPK